MGFSHVLLSEKENKKTCVSTWLPTSIELSILNMIFQNNNFNINFKIISSKLDRKSVV